MASSNKQQPDGEDTASVAFRAVTGGHCSDDVGAVSSPRSSVRSAWARPWFVLAPWLLPSVYFSNARSRCSQ